MAGIIIVAALILLSVTVVLILREAQHPPRDSRQDRNYVAPTVFFGGQDLFIDVEPAHHQPQHHHNHEVHTDGCAHDMGHESGASGCDGGSHH